MKFLLCSLAFLVASTAFAQNWTVAVASTGWTVQNSNPVASKAMIMVDGKWYKPNGAGGYTECVECNAKQPEQIPVMPKPVVSTPVVASSPCAAGCPCAVQQAPLQAQQMPQYAQQAVHYQSAPRAGLCGGAGLRGICGSANVSGGCGLFGGGRSGPIRNLLGLIFKCGG